MPSHTDRSQHLLIGLALIALLNLNACSHSNNATMPITKKDLPMVQSQQQDFYTTLSSLCGQRFIGKSSFPDNPEDSFYDKTLVATFLSCDEKEIRVPFSVGDNHSRTWIFRMTESGLQLKHQHLHEDGTPDEVSNYGGYANSKGTALSQYFPADDFTQKLLPEASSNVWNLALSEDGQHLTYYLERHNKPRFKATLQRADRQL